MSKEIHDFYRAPGSPGDSSSDYLVTATAMDGKVRALAIRTTQTCNRALRIHGTSPSATVALGRFMTGALLLAASLKGEKDTLTANIRCDGPIRGMTAVCDSLGNVRSYCIEPVVETFHRAPGKLDISAVVGKGLLTVVRDMGIKEPYVGSAELVSGEIGEDYANFLSISEQTRSIVSLGVLLDSEGVRHAGGFMIQLLPDAGDEVADYLERRANGGFPGVTFLLSEGMNPERILDVFLGDPDICFLSGRPVQYACPCSRDRMERSLTTLGDADLAELASDSAGIDLECHFCGSKYHFDRTDIEILWKNAREVSPNS